MKKLFAIVTLSLFIFACGFSVDFGDPTPTVAPTATTDDAATAAVIAEATYAVETQTAAAVLATEEAYLSKTAAAEMKQTERAELRLTGTAQSIISLTALAEPYYNEIAYLYDQGYISTQDGVYFPLDNFKESWAQMNWFNAWGTGYAPSNFVVSTDLEWESASDKANWFNSGCGFIFRADDKLSNFYVVFFTLDGYVELQRWQNNAPVYQDRQFYGTVEIPKGQAHLMISAEEDMINVFVNGQHILRRSDPAFQQGYLTYTLLSGTNKGFGTRCTMTNGGLWDFDFGSETGDETSSNG